MASQGKTFFSVLRFYYFGEVFPTVNFIFRIKNNRFREECPDVVGSPLSFINLPIDTVVALNSEWGAMGA